MAFTLTPKYPKGVSFDPDGRLKKYKATIYINKKLKHLGYFRTPEEAHQAYLDAKAKHDAEKATSSESQNGQQSME